MANTLVEDFYHCWHLCFWVKIVQSMNCNEITYFPYNESNWHFLSTIIRTTLINNKIPEKLTASHQSQLCFLALAKPDVGMKNNIFVVFLKSSVNNTNQHNAILGFWEMNQPSYCFPDAAAFKHLLMQQIIVQRACVLSDWQREGQPCATAPVRTYN